MKESQVFLITVTSEVSVQEMKQKLADLLKEYDPFIDPCTQIASTLKKEIQ